MSQKLFNEFVVALNDRIFNNIASELLDDLHAYVCKSSFLFVYE